MRLCLMQVASLVKGLALKTFGEQKFLAAKARNGNRGDRARTLIPFHKEKGYLPERLTSIVLSQVAVVLSLH